jgi:hypothetical protein
MSSGNDGSSRMAMLVIVQFDGDLLQHFDPRSWNQFVGQLARRGQTPVAWSRGKRPPPLGVVFSFTGLRGARLGLNGIDLTFCELGEADFEGACLQGAKLGSCPGASFHGAQLQGASFRGDISECRFEGAKLGADFQNAYFFADKPPIGLAPEALATCEVLPPSVDDADQMPPVPAEQVLRAKVTITEVPW